jgi:hypothetical protein
MKQVGPRVLGMCPKIEKSDADLTLRWRGGAITELEIDLPRSNPPTVRADEDTIALVRRLAAHYPDAIITGILNRQGRRTASLHRPAGRQFAPLLEDPALRARRGSA